METRDFGWALARLREGYQLQRQGWGGNGPWIKLQRPDGKSKMSLAYIYLKTTKDQFVPWFPSQTDMLETDWIVVD
jgi:hypothetical protein